MSKVKWAANKELVSSHEPARDASTRGHVGLHQQASQGIDVKCLVK